MVDQVSTATIRVEIDGEAQLRSITQAFQEMRGAAPRPRRVSAGAAILRAVGSAVGLGEETAERIGTPVVGAVVGPLNFVGNVARNAYGSILSFLGPIAGMGVSVASATVTFGGLGLVLAAVTVPAIALAGVLRLMRATFRWAEEGAESRLQGIARARRTFPGIVGEEFGQAQRVTSQKFKVVAAIMGRDAADSLEERITRRFTEFRLGRGLVGDRDIFARMGITQQALEAIQEMRGGERVSVNDWLFAFISERERLQAIIAQSPEGSAIRNAAVRQQARLTDDSFKLFGGTFRDILNTWSTDDIERLGRVLQASAPLAAGRLGQDLNQEARDFKIAMASLTNPESGTLAQLKRGIATDLQPRFTTFMTNLNTWLLEADDKGQSMGQSIRDLGSAIARHAWETLEKLVDRLDVAPLRRLIDKMAKWEPRDIVPDILWVAGGLVQVANIFAAMTPWIKWIFNPLGNKERWVQPGELEGERLPAAEGAAESWRERFLGWFNRPWSGYYAGAGGAGGGPAIGAGPGGAGPTVPGGAEYGGTGGTVAPGVLSGAAAAALSGGMAGVDAFMRQQGVPKPGAWCGAFAAAVVKSQGLQPPPNPQVAGSWRNWGMPVAGTPQPGDVAVVRGYSPRTGQEGKHVAFVQSYDPRTGNVVLVGGNQGAGRISPVTYKLSDLYIRRVPATAAGNAFDQLPPTPTATAGQPPAGAYPAWSEAQQAGAMALPPVGSANVWGRGGKQAAEAYLGRAITPSEYDALIRTVHAESSAGNSPEEQAMIMATILNRARAGSGHPGAGSIMGVLTAPSQFQAVTGTRYQPGPSRVYRAGPSQARQQNIETAAANLLHRVPRGQTRFTAASAAAYGAGTNIGYREQLRATGGPVYGGTQFTHRLGGPSPPVSVVAALPEPRQPVQPARAAQQLQQRPTSTQVAALQRPPPRVDTARRAQEGTAFGDAARDAIMRGARDMSIPVDMPTHEQQERMVA